MIWLKLSTILVFIIEDIRSLSTLGGGGFRNGLKIKGAAVVSKDFL